MAENEHTTPKQYRFSLGEWEGEVVSGFLPGNPLVGICLTRTQTVHCRYDLGKKVLIDAPSNVSVFFFTQNQIEQLDQKLQELMQSDVDRKLAASEAENARLRLEVQRLTGLLPGRRDPDPLTEECRGGCSRGGDGPSCGKLGCRG